MPTIVQQAIGAAQFTGLAGAGLIEFASALPGLSEDPDQRPIITGIALSNATGELLTFNCFLRPFAAANTTPIRKTIVRPVDAAGARIAQAGFNYDGCRTFVDRQIFGAAVDLRPWSLVLITSGAKADDAAFVVSFDVGSYRIG
jgi:hypothetical protein